MTLRSVRLAVAVLLAASLGACELTHSPTQPSRPVTQAPPPNAVTVAAGDTVYRIAQRHNVSVRAVIDANRLTPPYRLLPGQTLVIPAIAEHVVAAGETLMAIAQRYGTSAAELARLNNLKAPNYVIKSGQRLTLPAPQQAAAAAAPEPLAAKADRRAPAVQAQPLAQSTEPMPTLTGSRVLMVANSPALGGNDRGVPPPTTQQQPPLVQPAAMRSGAAPGKTVDKPVAAKQAEPHVPLAEPPVMKGGFTWPARGKLLARFGPLGKGQHNDGINIEVPRGAPVRAAADGVVAYAGNELRGFGNLLLIKHSDGWMSAYGHNDELAVRRGDAVKRGQVIAKAGASGNVRSPQLHFELRKNADAVDPLRHLPEHKAAAAEHGAG